MNGRLTLVYFSSLNDLKTRHITGRLMFYGYILTDGVSLNFVFTRLPSPSRLDLYAPDFNTSHITQGHFNIVGLDPGRRDVVTTAGGRDPGRYSERQVSTAEYHTISGATKRRQYLEIRKHTTIVATEEGVPVTMKQLESTLPTVSSSTTEAIRQRLSYLSHASSFYGIEQSRNTFKAYQGRQRATATTVNIALNGGPKYNRLKRSIQHKKQNRKRKKNRTAKRRRHRQARQNIIKAEYDTTHRQLLVSRQQLDILNFATRNLGQLDGTANVELLTETEGHSTALENQYASFEDICNSLLAKKGLLQEEYFKQFGDR
jgi:hypothetical protein